MRKKAKVYKWWDDELNCWRYDLSPVVDPDEVIEVTLPEHFDTYETECGQIFAYDTRTEPREENEYHDAWRVVDYEGWLTLVDAYYIRRGAIKLQRV